MRIGPIPRMPSFASAMILLASISMACLDKLMLKLRHEADDNADHFQV
jgi:hypothetical protein